MDTTEKKSPSHLAPNTSVRFPVGMKEMLASIAKANRRSLNSEIVDRLENSLQNKVVHEGFLEIKEDGGTDYTPVNDDPVSYENVLVKYFRQMTEEKRLALLELLRP